MAIEHSDIPDGEIHEPMGISGAANGTAYIADGAGSGAWASPPMSTAVNQVHVEALSDLPTPSAGVITLAADTVYTVSGMVDVEANRFEGSSNSHVVGTSRELDGFTSTTTSALFTSTANSLHLDQISVSVPSGSLVEFDGNGTESLLLINILLTSCASAGNITNSFLTVIRYFNLAASSVNGFKFSGVNNNKLNINNSTFLNFTGTCFDLTTDSPQFDAIFAGPAITLITPSGQTGFAALASSGNFTADGRGVISSNVFNGPGTHGTGLAADDLKWETFLNFGLPNSEAGCQGSIAGSALNTSFGGTGTPVVINLGAAFVADVENKFTISTAGRMTYIGLVDELFFFDATIFAKITGGASREYTYFLAKNGTTIASSGSKASYDGSNPGSNSLTSIVELGENDYIEVYVQADTATTDLNIDTASLKTFGVI